jgi:hypothetical protein
VITSVVVSYQVRPEAVAEHVRLIEAVFAQLRAEHPDNIEYKVVRLDDGVSFVHVSSADTPDGSNPLPELAAFKEFGRDSASRVATPPVPVAADIVGSYYPAVPVTGAGPGDRPPVARLNCARPAQDNAASPAGGSGQPGSPSRTESAVR